MWLVAFLADGKHVLSGSREGKIRRWRVEDGKEVGTPMDAGSAVLSIAVSRDGKWVVSGALVLVLYGFAAMQCDLVPWTGR